MHGRKVVMLFVVKEMCRFHCVTCNSLPEFPLLSFEEMVIDFRILLVVRFVCYLLLFFMSFLLCVKVQSQRFRPIHITVEMYCFWQLCFPNPIFCRIEFHSTRSGFSCMNIEHIRNSLPHTFFRKHPFDYDFGS